MLSLKVKDCLNLFRSHGSKVGFGVAVQLFKAICFEAVTRFDLTLSISCVT